MEEDKSILDQVKRIRGKFKTVMEDEEESKMSYLDELNLLIKNIFKDDPLDAYDVLSPDGLEKWKKSGIKRGCKKFLRRLNIKNALYFILLATITGFLVSEALKFYAIDGVISTKTYIKAILTEICFIFLSGYRTEGKLLTIWVNTLRASIFMLMLFVITNQIFLQGTKNISETNIIGQQVITLEKQIKEKEKQMDHYQKIGWPRNYTQTRIEKEKLTDKLFKLQEEQAQGKNQDVSEIERTRMYGRAAFRVLLLFISVLITRRLFVF